MSREIGALWSVHFAKRAVPLAAGRVVFDGVVFDSVGSGRAVGRRCGARGRCCVLLLYLSRPAFPYFLLALELRHGLLPLRFHQAFLSSEFAVAGRSTS